MKRFVVLFCIVTMLVAMTGIVNAAWKGEIVLWDAPRWAKADGTDQFHWMKGKIAEFEKAHPGVKIKLIETPWAQLGDKLNVAIAGRNWPDVAPIDISGGTIKIAHLKQGVVEPLDAFFTKEELKDYYPAALESYMYKGKLYGVPNSMTVHAMLLNLDIFKERGVEPPKNGRWTWDEFVDKMQKLTFDRNKDGKIDVYGFSTYIQKGYYEAWPFLLMDGARPLTSKGLFGFNRPEAISALEKLAALKYKYKVTPMEMGTANPGGTFQAFANPQQRTVAVSPWASWAIATIQTNPKYKMDNFMVAEYPIGKSGKPITIGGSGGFIIFKQQSKEKLAVVAEFVKSITTAEEQYIMAKNYGTFPARFSAAKMDPFKGNVQMKRASEMLEFAITVPRHPDWALIDDRIQAQLQLVFSGSKTPAEAMKAANNHILQYLGKELE